MKKPLWWLTPDATAEIDEYDREDESYDLSRWFPDGMYARATTAQAAMNLFRRRVAPLVHAAPNRVLIDYRYLREVIEE